MLFGRGINWYLLYVNFYSLTFLLNMWIKWFFIYLYVKLQFIKTSNWHIFYDTYKKQKLSQALLKSTNWLVPSSCLGIHSNTVYNFEMYTLLTYFQFYMVLIIWLSIMLIFPANWIMRCVFICIYPTNLIINSYDRHLSCL